MSFDGGAYPNVTVLVGGSLPTVRRARQVCFWFSITSTVIRPKTPVRLPMINQMMKLRPRACAANAVTTPKASQTKMSIGILLKVHLGKFGRAIQSWAVPDDVAVELVGGSRGRSPVQNTHRAVEQSCSIRAMARGAA